MSVNVEPIPPNDRTGLIAWLRRLAMSVAALARRLEELEKKVRSMEE